MTLFAFPRKPEGTLYVHNAKISCLLSRSNINHRILGKASALTPGTLICGKMCHNECYLAVGVFLFIHCDAWVALLYVDTKLYYTHARDPHQWLRL